MPTARVIIRADHVARLRVAAATGRLPPDLARDLLAFVAERAPAASARAERDDLLRRAAALLSGSLWARARRLALEVERHRGGRRRPCDRGDAPLCGLVVRALEVCPRGRVALRQILRVLGRRQATPHSADMPANAPLGP